MQALDTALVEIEPRILYFGTPVVLFRDYGGLSSLSTRNVDGSPNLAPMSSCWTLGWTAVLGLTLSGKTMENLQRERECVLNVPGPELWKAGNAWPH